MSGRQPVPRIEGLDTYPHLRKPGYSRLSGVYFVRSGDYVKVGVSAHVINRVQHACRAWNPHDVELLGWISEPHIESAEVLEVRLHEQFASARHRNEWFHATDELLAFILEHSRPFPTRQDLRDPSWPRT